MMNLIDMNKDEMEKVKCGCTWSSYNICKCACAYKNSGGSSNQVNHEANAEDDLSSPQCMRKDTD